MRVVRSTLALVAVLGVPTVSHAQLACAERDQVVSRLEAKYGETFSGGGMQNAKAIYEVWSSNEAGTWTILMTRPDGISCVMATGTNWREGPVVIAKEGVQG